MALTKISTAMISQSAAAVDLNVDAGTFYVDTTNNRVGVGGKTDPDTPLHVIGTVTATTFAGSGASLTNIPNSALTNSSITINSNAVSLGGSLTLDTDDLSEGSSNLYYTDARADARANARITATLIDEDDMSSNSASRLPSQQSVKAYVDSEVAGLVDSAPGTLNTLNELAAALGDDASFSTTVTNSIATKLPLAGGTLTGTLTGVGVVTNGARNIIQRSNDDSSIAFANNASGTPSGHVWAAGLNYSNSNAFTIAYGSSGIPSLESHKMVVTTTGNVGIGTDSPSGSLEVRNSTTATDTIIASAGLATAGNYHELILGDSRNYAVGLRRHITQSNPSYLRPRLDFIVQDQNTYLPADREVRMSIKDNGNVGIGTTSPGCALDIERSTGWAEVHLNGASGGDLILQDNGVNYGEIYAGNGHGMVLKAHSGQHMYFLTNGDATAKAVITSAGNVGIGTTSPAGPLHVDGHTGSLATILEGNGNGDTVPLHFRVKANNNNVTNHGIFGNAGSTGADNFIHIGPSNTSGISVMSTGNVGIGTSSPSQKLQVSGALVSTDQLTSPGSAGSYTYNATALDYSSNGARLWSWGSSTARGTFNFVQLENDGTNQQTAMSIDSSGNVGIGIASPSARFDVRIAGASGKIAEFHQNTGYGIDIGSSQSVAYISSGYNQRLDFKTDPTTGQTERMSILANGNVGIGTTSPLVKLDVQGSPSAPATSGTAQTGSLRVSQTLGNGVLDMGFYTSSNGTAWLQSTNKSNLSLNYDIALQPNGGRVGIGTESPGRKLHLKDGQIKFQNTGSGGWAGLDFSMGNGTYDGYMGMLDSDGKFFIDVDSNGNDFVILQNGNVGIGTSSPNAQLHIDPGTDFSKPSVIINSPSNYSEGDLYVLHGRDVNTGIGFSATGFGVNVQEEIPSDNRPQLRSNTGGLTSAGLMYVGADEVAQGVFGVMGVMGSAGTDLEHLFTVRSSGKVGIGTTDPTGVLDVRFSGRNGLYVGSTNGSGSFLVLDGAGNGDGAGGDYSYLEHNSNGHLIFNVGNSGNGVGERMRIEAGGNIGINENNPDGLLHIKKGGFGGTYSPDGADQLILENSDSAMIDIRTPNTNSGGVLFSDSDGRGRGILLYAHSNDTLYTYTASGVRAALNHNGLNIGSSTLPTSTLVVGVINQDAAFQLNGGSNGNASFVEKVDSKAGAYSSITVEAQLPGAGGYFYEIQTGSASTAASQAGGGYTNGTSNFSHHLSYGSNWTVTSPSTNKIRFVTSTVGTHPVVRIKIGCGLSGGLDQSDVTITYS